MKAPVLLGVLLLFWQSPQVLLFQKNRFFNTAAVEIFSFGVSKKMVLIEAAVDGKKGLFLFDTGASHLTLNKKHFQDKKVVNQVGESSNIIEDKVPLQAVKIKQFQFGGIQRKQLLCPIADLSKLENSLGYPILGLIGYDIVKNYQVHLDYIDHLLLLYPKNMEGSSYEVQPDYTLDFTLCGHLPVLETNIGLKQKIYLGLDSGASINVLDKSWQNKVADIALRTDKRRFTGAAAGVKEADYVVFEKMTIDKQFDLNMPGILLTTVGIPTDKCVRIDGLIGIDLFTCKRLAIDYETGKLHIWLQEGMKPEQTC